MYYVIQKDLFKEYNFRNLIECLERNKLDYEMVPFKPFVEEIEIKTDRKDIWLFGSVNAARTVQQYNWNPGSLYNENHDIEVYGQYYPLLNSDGVVIEAGDKLPFPYPMFFARPTKDTKAFSGQVFTRDSWNSYIEELKGNSTLGYLTDQTRIFIAPLKNDIQQEIRCWVVDGKVVTTSQYKIGNRVNYVNQDNNEEVMIFAQKVVNKFQVAKAFVLDICLYQDEYYVLEVNCINASGFYDANMSKLIQSLESAFE